MSIFIFWMLLWWAAVTAIVAAATAIHEASGENERWEVPIFLSTISALLVASLICFSIGCNRYERWANSQTVSSSPGGAK